MPAGNDLYDIIVQDLITAGEASPYAADADEPDPRYQSYGVRAPGRKQIFADHRKAIKALSTAEQLELGERLLLSGVADQQRIGMLVLEPHAKTTTPDRFEWVDQLMRRLYGWSVIDAITGVFLRDILFNHPEDLKPWLRRWNQDPDPWLRRASVVLFTRKVAGSGRFTEFALEMVTNLVEAPEDLVRKGVGWALKDLMKQDKPRILEVVRTLRRQEVSSVITLYALKELKGEERKRFLAT